MKGKFAGIVLTVTMCGAVFLSGCSFGGLMNKMTGNGKESVKSVSSSSLQAADFITGKKVDDSLEAPVFEADLTGLTGLVQGSSIKIQAKATVNDGGTVTYQWYRNNVNQNGGGTAIAGGNNSVLTVDASEARTVYYYCVATNTKGSSVNMSVSNIRGIQGVEAGQWKKDANGYKYVLKDGTSPAGMQFIENGKLYLLNDAGYINGAGSPAPEYIEGTPINQANQAVAAQNAQQ